MRSAALRPRAPSAAPRAALTITEAQRLPIGPQNRARAAELGFAEPPRPFVGPKGSHLRLIKFDGA